MAKRRLRAGRRRRRTQSPCLQSSNTPRTCRASACLRGTPRGAVGVHWQAPIRGNSDKHTGPVDAEPRSVALEQDFRKVATGFRTKILLRQKTLSKHSLARQRMFAESIFMFRGNMKRILQVHIAVIGSGEAPRAIFALRGVPTRSHAVSYGFRAIAICDPRKQRARNALRRGRICARME